jgi:hypothetical protein
LDERLYNLNALKIWVPANIFPSVPEPYERFAKVGYIVDDFTSPSTPSPILINFNHHAFRKERFADGQNHIDIFLPIGLGNDIHLLRQIKPFAKSIYIVINGFQIQTIASIRSIIPEHQLVFVYEDPDAEEIALQEQLVWMRTQPEPFALHSSRENRLRTAAALGAAALILRGDSPMDLSGVLRVFAAGKSLMRPCSPLEVDHLEEKSASVILKRFCSAGTYLQSTDLRVSVTKERGISPVLLDKVIGLRLRYDTEKETPLTFGLLEDGTS